MYIQSHKKKSEERASDWNISGAYTRGSKEDLESVFKKIPYEHTSDLHCKNVMCYTLTLVTIYNRSIKAKFNIING